MSASDPVPTEIDGLTDADYDELERLARDDRVVAVWETGLDYYWDRTAPAAQQDHFRRHIDLAKRVGKALMIHGGGDNYRDEPSPTVAAGRASPAV